VSRNIPLLNFCEERSLVMKLHGNKKKTTSDLKRAKGAPDALSPPLYPSLYYNTKFWRAPIGRNRSRDEIVSLLSGRLSAHSARFLEFLLKI